MRTPHKIAGPQKDSVFWFLMAVGFTWGAVYNFLPVTFPIFRRELHASLEQLGRTQLVFLISALLVSVAGGWMTARMGLKRTAGMSLVLLAAGLAVIGYSGSFAQLLFGCFVFGSAVACLMVAASAMVTAHFGEQRQSVFFLYGMADAAGSIAGPALLGQWLGRAEGESWRIGYGATALLIVALALWALRLRTGTLDESARAQNPFRAMRTVLASPAIYFIGMAMFLHGVAQVGMTSWIGEFFRETRGIGTAEAALFLSINSVGFLAGRSVLGALTARFRIPELLILAICAAGGTLAFAATIGAPDYRMGLIGFALAGLFISGDGPSINSFVGKNWPASTATAFAILNGMGNIGGAAGPYVTGLIGTRVGIEKGIQMMPAFSLALAALSLVWYFARRRNQVPAAVEVGEK